MERTPKLWTAYPLEEWQKKRQAARRIPLVPCVIAHHAFFLFPQKTRLAMRVVATGVPAVRHAGEMWAFVVCCNLGCFQEDGAGPKIHYSARGHLLGRGKWPTVSVPLSKTCNPELIYWKRVVSVGSVTKHVTDCIGSTVEEELGNVWLFVS